MDQFYVTPDGQIAQLPKRSFLDRLTSGLYDASVEWRKPGGAQEARLARTQPLTSALNQYGAQQRGFTQEEKMLGKQQEFAAGQNTLNRDNQWAMADFEAGRAMERARLEREARAKEFEATHGLAQRVEDRMTLDRNMKGWDTAKTFMMEMPKTQAEIERLKAVAANEAAQQKLYEAQTSALSQTVSPEALALMGALNPKLAPVIAANPGMTNIPVSTLGKVLAAREGTSGRMDPETLKMLLGVQEMPSAPVSTNTVQRIKLR